MGKNSSYFQLITTPRSKEVVPYVFLLSDKCLQVVYAIDK